MNSLLCIPKPFDRFQQLNAPRAVKRVARQDDQPAPKGRGGRPRKDAERNLIARLRSEGKSWKQVAKTINKETGLPIQSSKQPVIEAAAETPAGFGSIAPVPHRRHSDPIQAGAGGGGQFLVPSRARPYSARIASVFSALSLTSGSVVESRTCFT
jgi:hypothetical protein